VGRRADALSPQERLFAVEVRRAYAAASVSQEWIGNEIGLSRGKVSEMCAGYFLPQLDTLSLLIEALGMDRERVVALWQDARRGRAARLRAERIAPVVGWSQLPALPPEITSLLQAQIQMAEESPYRLRGARRPSLSTVYVRQELGIEETQPDKRVTRPVAVAPDATSPEWRPGPVTRSAPPRPSVRPPARKVREALDADDHLLVIGGPGQGKSTLTLRLAADIAQAWLRQLSTGVETVTEGEPQLLEPVVPLRLSARVLAARLDMPFPHALADSISAEYGPEMSAPVDAGLLAGRIAGCRWLLLIDAIDEVADPEVRHRLIRALSGCFADDRPYRVVVTSRPLDGGGLAPLYRGAARYELQPFDAAALRRFAEHWFSPGVPSVAGDACHRFLEQIRRAHLDELVRVPLLATIAAIIFGEHGDRPLPDNRYGLYEEYLKYLAEARPATSDRFRQVVWDLRAGLLEHLGLARFEADVPLLQAAQAWIADHTREHERPAHWEAALTVHLVAIGPLRIRGDDDEVQFMHHSFADHLAATAKGRLLPVPFDADHPIWQQAIHATRHGMSTDHARTVILHGTHLHKGLADQLVNWLHHNTADFQVIAAELLAQHAPISAPVVDEFLKTARAWAKTSSGTEIFRQVTHATHHPRLASWLSALLHQPDVTWTARIEAATALCTRVWSNEDEAIRLLKVAIDDRTLDLDDRLTAAQGLAEAGPEQHKAATAALRAILDDPATTGYTLCDAAIALADTGSESRDHAIHVLRKTIAEDSTASVDGRRLAAATLAELGLEFQPAAAAVFLAIIDDPALKSDWSPAARALGELGPGYIDQAVTLLVNMINNRGLHVWERATMASALTDLGTEYVPLAAGHLFAILADPALKPPERQRVAEVFAKLDPQYHGEAAIHFRQVLADPTTNTNSLLWAAKGLADLVPEFHQEAAEQLRRMYNDPLAEEWERCDAASSLAALGPAYRDQAADLLRAVLHQSSADVEFRHSAATELIVLGTEFHDELTSVLRLIVADIGNDDMSRVRAASTLAGLDSSFAAQAAAVAQSALSRPAVTGRFRRMIASNLSRLGTRYRLVAAEHLRAVLANGSYGWFGRVTAARDLVELGHDLRAEAMAGFRTLLAERASTPYALRNIVDHLRAFGTDFRAEAGDLLSRIATDPARDQSAHVAAAIPLGEFWREHQGTAVAVLRAALLDPTVDRHRRIEAAMALTNLGSQYRADAVTCLREVLADPGIYSGERRQAIEALAHLGEEHRREAIAVLRTVLDDQGNRPAHRRIAAAMLAGWGGECRTTAVAELLEQTNDPATSIRDRVQAIWQLANVDISRRADAEHRLAVVVSDTNVEPADRCKAGEYLVQLGRNHWLEVTSTFRTMLASPLISPQDMLSVVDSLVVVKAIGRRERIQIVVAIANDPRARAVDRRDAAERLMHTDYDCYAISLELQRELLADRGAPVPVRLVTSTQPHMADELLLDQKVVALREVLASLESDTQDRLDALAALAKLGRKSEAVQGLRLIITDSDASTHVRARALVVLGEIDEQHRVEAIGMAEGIVSDGGRSFGERLAAAGVLMSLCGWVGSGVAEFLAATLRRPGISELDVVRVANWLAQVERREDTVSVLRRIVLDSQVNPHIRQRAGLALARWRPGERGSVAEVLDSLAGKGVRSAARWRAAEALAAVGERDKAIARLHAIMRESDVSARVRAAEALMGLCPQDLEACVGVLRAVGHGSSVRVAHRVRALVRLGSVSREHCDEAVAALREIAASDDVTVRCRAVGAMVGLRRDLREEAALVVRSVARDVDVAWHIRVRAARFLARWSALCRDEAYEVLRSLR
jgi:hypothetical protein